MDDCDGGCKTTVMVIVMVIAVIIILMTKTIQLYTSVSCLCNYRSIIDVIIYLSVQYPCFCALFPQWMVPFFPHRGEIHLCTYHCTAYNYVYLAYIYYARNIVSYKYEMSKQRQFAQWNMTCIYLSEKTGHCIVYALWISFFSAMATSINAGGCLRSKMSLWLSRRYSRRA